MRQIKFKVVCKDSNVIILTIQELLDKGLKLADAEIVGVYQFTGMTDINGAEIYEGDTVILRRSQTGLLYSDIQCTVVFERGAFYAKNTPSSVGTLLSANIKRTELLPTNSEQR